MARQPKRIGGLYDEDLKRSRRSPLAFQPTHAFFEDKTNGSQPVTIEAKAEEADDGDGVAT
jgi:hypothetical protein